MRAGYYVMELLPTSESDEMSVWAIVEWCAKDNQLVKRTRETMRDFSGRGKWWVVETGPAPRRVLGFEIPGRRLERLLDRLAKIHYRPGVLAARITKPEFERIRQETQEDNIYRLDCVHLAITDISVAVAGYGKYSGQKFESINLEGTEIPYVGG